MKTTIKSFIEAPRWAGIEDWLRILAFKNSLTIETLLTKGLLTQRVDFKASGSVDDIENFRLDFHKGMEQMNA